MDQNKKIVVDQSMQMHGRISFDDSDEIRNIVVAQFVQDIIFVNCDTATYRRVIGQRAIII